MAGNEPRNLLTSRTTYSFNEAIDYLKQRDRQPTKTDENVRWFNVKTGKEVVIGYTYI